MIVTNLPKVVGGRDNEQYKWAFLIVLNLSNPNKWGSSSCMKFNKRMFTNQINDLTKSYDDVCL